MSDAMYTWGLMRDDEGKQWWTVFDMHTYPLVGLGQYDTINDVRDRLEELQSKEVER